MHTAHAHSSFHTQPQPQPQVPEKQLARRKRAVDALGEHTRVVLEQLRDAEDELLAGNGGCCCPCVGVAAVTVVLLSMFSVKGVGPLLVLLPQWW